MSAAVQLENQQSRLIRNLPHIVTVICVLQPLMDVLSFWLSELGMSNAPTLLLRFGVNEMLSAALMTAFIMALRILATVFKWNLPQARL